MHPRDRLIVALDVPKASDALRLAEELSGEVGLLKIGLELFCAEGPDLVKRLAKHAPIFLDLKFLDIPNTVQGALKSILPLDPYFLTLHATGGARMMEGVRDLLRAHRQQGGRTQSLAVTVLTSFNEEVWKELGHANDTRSSALNLGLLAQHSGMDGVVCSPQEVGHLRQHLGPHFNLICPGIRPSGNSLGDQIRVSDPTSAIRAGANYLVVGRPITEATSPREAARLLIQSIQ